MTLSCNILIMDVFNESIQDFYRASENYRIPRYLSQRLKTSAGSLVLCLVLVFLLLMSIGILDIFLCDSLTFFFPAKWTLKSISNPDLTSDKLWTTYWLIYSILKLLDAAIPFLIQFIPFYYLIKFCFLVILCAPNLQGALMIYNNLLSQLIREHKLQYLFDLGSKKKRYSY